MSDQHHRPHILLLTAVLIFSVASEALTKSEAYDLLKKSDRWRLTETIFPEAREKTVEVESVMKPRTELVFRQFVARTNPIQYGGDPTVTPITTLGFGTSALAASWTLMDPLAKANILLARSKELSSTDQAQQYQLDLTAGMLIQFLNVQKLKKQFELSEANLEKSELILRLATAKHSVGAGIPLEVARAKNLVSLDRIKKMSAYTKFLKAKHDLTLTLGLERLDTDIEPLQPQMLKMDDYQSVLKSAIENRPDLKASRSAIDSARDAQHEAQKKFFPKLQFVAEAGTTDVSMVGLPGKTLNGFAGVNLTIPLDSGGLIDAKRSEARVLVMKSEIGLREKLNEITSQIKEALENLSIASEGLNAADAYVKTAREEASIADKRFNAGASTGLDFTSAHTSLANAEDNLNELAFNYEAARVSYYHALGNFQDYFK